MTSPRHFVRPVALATTVIAIAAIGASSVSTVAAATTSGCVSGGPHRPIQVNDDLNGDGTSDSIVGIPTYDKNHGAVEIRLGYKAAKTSLIRPGLKGLPATGGSASHFGAAIAAGDFNNDGITDLAIGEPDRTVEDKVGAGAVQYVYGGKNGFKAGPLVTQASLGVPGQPTTGAHFGASLVYGRTPTDIAEKSLVIGVPGATVNNGTADVAGAGEVVELDYVTTVKTVHAAETYWQGEGIQGEPVSGAHLGSVVGWDYAVPVAGAPDETVDGMADAGFWGTVPDTATNAPQPLSESGAQAGERLGASFANTTWASDGDGLSQDFLVGAPGMTVDGKANAGAVIVYENDDGGGTPIRKVLTLDSPGVPGTAATDAHFGSSVAGLDDQYNAGAAVIGIPGQTVAGHKNAGAVLTADVGDQASFTCMAILDQATAKVAGVAETGDEFGSSLFMTDRIGSFAYAKILDVGIQYEDLGKASNAGTVEQFPAPDYQVKSTPSSLIEAKPPTTGQHYGQVFPAPQPE